MMLMNPQNSLQNDKILDGSKLKVNVTEKLKSVFKRLLSQGRSKLGLSGKELTHVLSNNIYLRSYLYIYTYMYILSVCKIISYGTSMIL